MISEVMSSLYAMCKISEVSLTLPPMMMGAWNCQHIVVGIFWPELLASNLQNQLGLRKRI